jgi:hypothetical protein
MKSLTKKRFVSYLIDSWISTAVSYAAERVLRKRIKNEAFHVVLLPILTQYSLEYIQLKQTGKTIGYRLTGLELYTADGKELTGEQIVKRMVHRDTTSTMNYFLKRQEFETGEGAVLPHDKKVSTIVRETK